MKQFITLLLVILVSIPVSGQTLNQKEQESEFEMTTNFFNPLIIKHKRDKDFQTRDIRVQRKTEMLRSTASEKRYLDSLTNQEWDNDFNTWRFTTKQEFTYDSDRLIMSILYMWNGNTSSWDPFLKNEYTFDTYGNLTSEIQSYQFTPNVWDLNKKTEYTYNLNPDGVYKLILEEEFSWGFQGPWVSTYKYELTYDDFETMVVQEIGYEWNPGMNDWINMYNDDYFYTNGLLSSIIQSLWNYGGSKWDLNSKWDYFRDSFPINEEIQYRWEPDPISDWVQESRFVYEYGLGPDAMPILTIETAYIWDTDIDDWENYYMDEYQYDGNFNRTTATYFDWIETPGEWVPYYKDEFIFDMAYSFSDLIVPFNYKEEIDDTSVFFNNMVIGYRGYEYFNPLWEDDMKMLFYYSNYTNPLKVDDKVLSDAIRVYPNPVSNILIVDSEIPLTKVEIYSVFGKKVKDIHFGFEAIPLSNLSDGIYIVRIKAENRVMTKKIIKSTLSL
jgi:hypothetical protein